VGDMAAMFGMGGAGGGAPGGMPPMGGPGMETPGAPNPMAQDALSALDQLAPKQANPTAAMQQVEKAIDLAYRLVMTAISQVGQWNPKVAKDGHQVSRTLLNMKSELRKEATPGPTPDLMLGMGMAGAPGPLGPGAGGGTP
jgi:hypothetical protein